MKKLELYVKDKNVGSLRSMKILEDFLNTDMKLFEGVEITMQQILCADVKISVVNCSGY